MNRVNLAVVACLSIGGLAATGCGPKEFGSLCDTAPAPVECQVACDPTPGVASSCTSGYYCSPDGHCDAQCTIGGGQCGEGYTCSEDGRCIDGSGSGSNGPDASCPAINFTPMPTTPSIGLVLDQSGSMFSNNISGVTRYKAMRDALVGTAAANGADGVVTQLESKAYFGSLLYTCPTNTAVPRALNNAGPIRTSIDSKTSGGNTPTHWAINEMVASFAAAPPPAGSPPVIVLATDGLPNSCSSGAGTGGGTTPTVQAARDAYAAGIPLYVLAINQDSQHFQDVANAGQGWIMGQPNITYYPVANAADLATAFQTIINGVISCDLSLTSSIDPAQAMNGTVVVNGVTLTYGVDWILVNGNLIRLQGQACADIKASANPMVSATFPCGSVIL